METLILLATIAIAIHLVITVFSSLVTLFVWLRRNK